MKLYGSKKHAFFSTEFSAAICRGLIEAAAGVERYSNARGFPRQFAAASLKRDVDAKNNGRAPQFSAAICRGLIEAALVESGKIRFVGFPRQFAAASLKLRGAFLRIRWQKSFPRQFAAASLKHG